MKNLKFSTILLPVVVFIFNNCNIKQRAINGFGDGTKKVIVTVTNLADGDQLLPTWSYELSGCVPSAPGTLNDDKTVTVTSTKLTKNLSGCELRIKTLVPMPSTSFTAEPNLLYLAKNFDIRLSSTGQFVADAIVTKLYGADIGLDVRFTLNIAVTLPQDEPQGTPISGFLDDCNQTFTSLGTYQFKNTKSGVLILNSSATLDPVAIYCKKLWVDAGGIARKYFANLPDSAKFIAKAKDSTTLPDVINLSVNPNAGNPASDPNSLVVETVPADAKSRCNYQTQVFNTASSKCVPKTNN